MSELPVIVAGGGIAGLAAAIAIARTGRRVVVFEKDAEPSPEGAGLQLSPNATRHLEAWGVLAGLEDAALSPAAVVVRRGRDAAVLARLDLRNAETRFGAPFRIAHRADVHASLAGVATNQPCLMSRNGAAVVGWREGRALIVATSDGGTHDAAALVIADGVHSRLRATFERGAGALVHSGRVAWRTLIPADRCDAPAREPASNLWLGPDAHLVHYPLRGGSVVNVVAIIAGERARERHQSWSRAGELAAVARQFSAWHRDVRALIASADNWRVWPLFSRAAPGTLAHGRVALVGDAAHPMMPFLAQGAAQAIEDAAALGDAFARSDDAAAALAKYGRARLKRVGSIMAASERQATLYHLGGPVAAARDLALRAGGERGMRLATDWIYRG